MTAIDFYFSALEKEKDGAEQRRNSEPFGAETSLERAKRIGAVPTPPQRTGKIGGEKTVQWLKNSREPDLFEDNGIHRQENFRADKNCLGPGLILSLLYHMALSEF